jgi:hypothetical protein
VSDKYVNIDTIRIGDIHDSMKLTDKFIQLNYTVELIFDKTGQEIKVYFDKLAQDERLKHFESLVLFMSSHGSSDGVIDGYDGEEVSIKSEILKPLNNSIYLQNKPKIIFINACRGQRGSNC